MVASRGRSFRSRLHPIRLHVRRFLSRAYDFVRMRVSPSQQSVSPVPIGLRDRADGPSQMALEDIASLARCARPRALPERRVSTAKLVAQMADLRGISYIRTTRGAYPVCTERRGVPDRGSKVIRQSTNDVVALIGAGVTLHACIAAAERLSNSGISCRVIDLYSVKPIDTATLRAASEATAGRLVVVEDHYRRRPWCGGDGGTRARGEPPRITHLAVRDLPGSASPDELMAAAGIDADAIVAA